MDAKEIGILGRLAVSSLEKCLAKLSAVSAGTWRVDSISVSPATPGDAFKRHDFTNPAAAVYFNVEGEFPFASVMLFDPQDIECISKCFLGYSFPGAPGLKQSEEAMLVELGNIVLNSVVSAVSDGLKKILTPTIPSYAHGDAGLIVEELGTVMDAEQRCRVIIIRLAIQCGGLVSTSELFGLIPEKLADELERRSA